MLQHKVDLTYIQAMALKTSWEIRTDRAYYITDKEIILTGISPTDFSLEGHAKFTNWIRSKWGLKLVDGWSLASIDSITVNGVEVLWASVAYTSDIYTFVQDIANQINTFVSAPDYEAFPVWGWVCISSINTWSVDNWAIINATFTGTGTLTTRPFAWWIADYDVRDYVHYDLSNDTILLRKSKEDVEISYAATYPSNPIQMFEYRGSPAITWVRAHNSLIQNLWIDGGVISDITLDNYSTMLNIAVIDWGNISNVKCALNQLIWEVYVGSWFLQWFDWRNWAVRRMEIDWTWSFYQTYMNGSFLYNATISSWIAAFVFNTTQINRFTTAQWTILQDNVFTSSNINHFNMTDTLTYGPEFLKNNFTGCFIGDFNIDSASVTNNTFNNVSMNAIIYDWTTQANYSTYENFASSTTMQYTWCSVSRNKLSSLNLIANYSMIGTQFTDNEIYNTGFRWTFQNSIITNNRLNCKNNFIGAWGLYTDIRMSNHDASVWYGKMSVEYKDMNWLAGTGQIGTDIILWHLPFITTIVDQAVLVCDALASATNTAELSFWVDVDDAAGISSSTLITTLNVPYIPALSYTNPTTDLFRALIATPTVEDVTAWRVRLVVEYHYDYN